MLALTIEAPEASTGLICQGAALGADANDNTLSSVNNGFLLALGLMLSTLAFGTLYAVTARAHENHQG